MKRKYSLVAVGIALGLGLVLLSSAELDSTVAIISAVNERPWQ